MPMHDWTRVPAGIFHTFRKALIDDLQKALEETYNRAWSGVPQRWRRAIETE